MNRDALDRFIAKTVPAPMGCLEWTGSKTPGGYGMFHYGGKKVYAHRFSYSMVSGEIPARMVIDHLCRNPSCVNPEHLDCVPMAENTRRGLLHEVIRAKAAAKSHCKRGHLLSGSNVRLDRDGHRCCAACQRLKADEWKIAHRARVNELQRKRRAATAKVQHP